MGKASCYTPVRVRRWLTAYPLVAHVRDERGSLVGLVTAFSDRVWCTQLGEIVVDRRFRRRGVGSALLALVERVYPNVPIFVRTFADAEAFFRSCGFRETGRPMCVLSKCPVRKL